MFPEGLGSELRGKTDRTSPLPPAATFEIGLGDVVEQALARAEESAGPAHVRYARPLGPPRYPVQRSVMVCCSPPTHGPTLFLTVLLPTKPPETSATRVP